jgi:hypothetical protein
MNYIEINSNCFHLTKIYLLRDFAAGASGAPSPLMTLHYTPLPLNKLYTCILYTVLIYTGKGGDS